jgi:hypothetical protein
LWLSLDIFAVQGYQIGVIVTVFAIVQQLAVCREFFPCKRLSHSSLCDSDRRLCELSRSPSCFRLLFSALGARRASSEQIYLACAASPANPLILASAASIPLLSPMGQVPNPHHRYARRGNQEPLPRRRVIQIDFTCDFLSD